MHLSHHRPCKQQLGHHLLDPLQHFHDGNDLMQYAYELGSLDQMDQLQRSIHSVFRLSQLLHKYLHSFLQQKEQCSIMFYHQNSLQMYLVHCCTFHLTAIEPLAGPVNSNGVKPDTRRAYLESVTIFQPPFLSPFTSMMDPP